MRKTSSSWKSESVKGIKSSKRIKESKEDVEKVVEIRFSIELYKDVRSRVAVVLRKQQNLAADG